MLYCKTVGEGAPVLLVHGYGADHRLMAGCCEPVFAQRPGYKRFYPDLPGMGQSPHGGVQNADDVPERLVELIEAKLPPGPFLLAGESYGGYMAQGLLARMPQRIRGVLLLCSVVVTRPEDRDVPPHTVLLNTLGDGANEAPNHHFATRAVVRTPEALARYERDLLPGLRAGDRAFVKEFYESRYPFAKTPAFTTHDGPALVLTGRQDSTVGWRDALPLLQRLPRATFATLDMAGHNLQIERPALFEALAVDWLDRVEQTTA